MDALQGAEVKGRKISKSSTCCTTYENDANICKISRSPERKRPRRTVIIPPNGGIVVTEVDEMRIVTMDEMAGVGMTSAKGRHHLPDVMTTVDARIPTAGTGVVTTTGLIGSAHGLLIFTDDRMPIGVGARAPTDVVAKRLITWTFLVATAVTCLTCRSSSCRMSTRTLSTGCNEPSTTVA